MWVSRSESHSFLEISFISKLGAYCMLGTRVSKFLETPWKGNKKIPQIKKELHLEKQNDMEAFNRKTDIVEVVEEVGKASLSEETVS